MAIRPSTEYAGQVDTSDPTGYPYGAAQNVTSPGDGLGTPLEALWLSDLWGWLQALLAAAAITPSNTPDKVGASDYLDALDTLYPRKAGDTFTGAMVFSGTATFSGATAVFSSSTAVAFNGGFAAFDSCSFSSTADVTFGAAVTFEALATFEAAVVCEDNLTVTGVLWSTGGFTLSAQMSAQAEIFLNGAGRIRQRVTLAGDANESHGVTATDILFIPATGITGDHDYTIANSGASVGSTMLVKNGNALHTATLKMEDASTITTLSPGESALLVRADFGSGAIWTPGMLGT